MASHECVANPPAAAASAAPGSGAVWDFGGMKAYVTGSPDAKLAVVFISDAFGFEAPILRKIADRVASLGYFVVVPDFMHDDPYRHGISDIPAWLSAHSPDKACEEAKPVIAAMKEQGVSVVGAAGYCWGAKVVVELAKESEIQAAVLLHPSLITPDDMKVIKCPVSILAAEVDHTCPPEVIKQCEQALATSEIDRFVKIFPGVSHGWAVRYDEDDGTAVQHAEEAFADMTRWFSMHLK